jgi:hypothetical protein
LLDDAVTEQSDRHAPTERAVSGGFGPTTARWFRHAPSRRRLHFAVPVPYARCTRVYSAS